MTIGCTQAIIMVLTVRSHVKQAALRNVLPSLGGSTTARSAIIGSIGGGAARRRDSRPAAPSATSTGDEGHEDAARRSRRRRASRPPSGGSSATDSARPMAVPTSVRLQRLADGQLQTTSAVDARRARCAGRSRGGAARPGRRSPRRGRRPRGAAPSTAKTVMIAARYCRPIVRSLQRPPHRHHLEHRLRRDPRAAAPGGRRRRPRPDRPRCGRTMPK